jgi:hypothetical protein
MDDKRLAAVAQNYGRLSPEILEPLLDLLATASVVSDGDLDKLMIMIVVGLRSMAHPAFKERGVMDFIEKGATIPTLGINARSISESLPIPRESARRKVARLIDLGWLRREGGNLHLTAKGLAALTPVRDKIQRQVVANYETVASLDARVPAG